MNTYCTMKWPQMIDYTKVSYQDLSNCYIENRKLLKKTNAIMIHQDYKLITPEVMQQREFYLMDLKLNQTAIQKEISRRASLVEDYMLNRDLGYILYKRDTT